MHEHTFSGFQVLPIDMHDYDYDDAVMRLSKGFGLRPPPPAAAARHPKFERHEHSLPSNHDVWERGINREKGKEDGRSLCAE